VQEPKHPYTRLLIGSIPLPDPDQPWQAETAVAAAAEISAGNNGGCRFAPRCPFASEICVSGPPPVVDVGVKHWSRCVKAPLEGVQA